MNIEFKDIPSKLADAFGAIRKYTVIIFILLVVGVYGFLTLRISSMQSVQPSAVGSTKQVTHAVTPHIDEKVVKQLQQLEDNSVSVKSLFDQARTNPFVE